MCCCSNNETLTMSGAKDPVCGMTVAPSMAAGKSEFRNATYYFCSKSCKERFDRNPESYVGLTTPTAQERTEIDLVCGMQIAPSKAAATSVHGGQTFYFCSKGCAAKFSADPQKFLKPQAKADQNGPHVHSSAEYTCPCIPRPNRAGRVLAPSAEWLSRPRQLLRQSAVRNTPAPCIWRSSAPSRERARSVEWLWNRVRSLVQKPIRS